MTPLSLQSYGDTTFASFDAMLIAINFVNGYIQNGNSFVDVSSGNKKLICNCKLCEFREAKGHMLQQWEKHNLIASIPPIHLSRVNPHNYEILRKMQDYETLNHFHETPYHNIVFLSNKSASVWSVENLSGDSLQRELDRLLLRNVECLPVVL